MESVRNIQVSCPVCEVINNISIPEKFFTQKKFGKIKIQVPQGGVCPDHNFIVLINIKGIIRGYVQVDEFLNLR